jgi:hypothetical protein
MGGLQSRSGRGGEEKNSQPLPGLETPMIQLVAHLYATELSRLLVGGRVTLKWILKGIVWEGVDWIHLAHNNA